MSFSGAFRSSFSQCSRSSLGANIRISCSAAGARTSFSKPSASSFAFARNASSKPAHFQASSGLSSFLNSPPSAFGSKSCFASATAGVPGATRASSAPSTSSTSTSSVSTTSTGSSSSSSAAGVLSDDSDANDSDSESSRIPSFPFEAWSYPNTAVRPRLEEYYRQSILEDLLILTYDHSSPDADLKILETKYKSEWMPDHSLRDLFSVSIEELPTFNPNEPITSLMTKYASSYEPAKANKLEESRSLLDYSNVPSRAMKKFLNPPPPPPPPFAPLPNRMPAIKSIVLKIWQDSAAQNNGVRADPVFAERGDASKKIREGMPLGAQVKLTHSRMYAFLDKLVHCVLPKIPEWDGFNPVGNGKGAVSFVIPYNAVGQFPDIENYFEMFPRLFDITVEVQTTATRDKDAITLLSAFQVPFLPELEKEEVDADDEIDPWAKFKKGKKSNDMKNDKKK
ncbi:hypothetical protein HK096_009799 [Nowakowskiella sp. JEL0078]|nr:hypothetical protein HK096_009799 [Nowakowskiella sp. JEL0078]